MRMICGPSSVVNGLIHLNCSMKKIVFSLLLLPNSTIIVAQQLKQLVFDYNHPFSVQELKTADTSLKVSLPFFSIELNREVMLSLFLLIKANNVLFPPNSMAVKFRSLLLCGTITASGSLPGWYKKERLVSASGLPEI